MTEKPTGHSVMEVLLKKRNEMEKRFQADKNRLVLDLEIQAMEEFLEEKINELRTVEAEKERMEKIP
ncbi:uncharacterized [Tachysurus ichikawai]